MEQTAVHLMSRKQRAAKLLTGDIGLTGLDALTEGEGGFEEVLLEAIGREEALVNPGELFKANTSYTELDAEDAAYWNVKSAPVRRLLEAAGPGRVLNMTYGYPRQSVVLLDNGYLAVVSLTVEELLEHLDFPDGGE